MFAFLTKLLLVARSRTSNGGVDCVDKMALLHFLVTAGAGVMFSIDTERRFPTFLSTGWFNRGGVEMSKVTWKRIVAPIAVLLLVVACRTEASATDTEAAIRSLETSFAAAVRAKDLDKIMAHYTVSEDLVVFDVVPPRQYTGWKAYKEDWREFLAGCKDSPTFEISELETYGGARYAYSHSIQHFSCTNQQGKKRDLILRVTDGYANFGGEWLIAHEHVSVPVDLTTGQAVLQSKP